MLFSQSDSIRINYIDIDKAIEQSKQQHKPVFFMCYASWCSHCHKMRTEVFKDSAVASFYNMHYVCAAMDMEKGDGIAWHDKLRIRNYPTLIYLDSNGTILYRLAGEFTAANFIAEGKNAMIIQNQLPFIKQQFESDITNGTNCLAYILALRKGDMDAVEPAKKYFTTQSDEQLLTILNWRIFANGITAINSREFQFVLAHQKEFAAITSTFRVDRKITTTVVELLYPFVNSKDTINYLKYRPLAISMRNKKVDSLVFTYDIALAEATSNWGLYQFITKQYVNTFISTDYFSLNHVAKVYLQHIDDKVALQQAINWVNKSILIHEEYPTYILFAQLNKKIGNTKDAIDAAEKGKKIAEKLGWDTKEANELLHELK
jgi:thioredoxin-related protein